MTVYSSVRVTTVLLCNCKVYKFPHTVGKNLCSSKIPAPDKISLKISSRAFKQLEVLYCKYLENDS